jgi:putative intracellular protease/amidase
MVLTSHDRLGDTGEKTGVWLSEFAAPYFIFKNAGAEITLASPKGGQPPLDPKSVADEARSEATIRFQSDPTARWALAHTVKLSTIAPDDFDAVFFPGGHGPLWDLAEDRDCISLIEHMFTEGKVIAAVCHGPAVLRRAKRPDGTPLVHGKAVTGFSNAEEAAAGLARSVPFLVEDALMDNGANYSKAFRGRPHVVVDGNLITGQNPASAQPAAQAVLHHLTSALAHA